MYEFANPHLLFLLALLLPLAWATLRKNPHARPTLRFSDTALLAALPTQRIRRYRLILSLMNLAALALLIIAMARPRFGTTERQVTQEGLDLIYCLDISGSMRAEDFRPNRLEKAKELIDDFAQKRKTDRQGLTLFSGAAFTLCPLTYDIATFQEFLKQVSFDDIGVQGTAIGDGLARALKKLKTSKAKSRVIILMTDGENNAGEIDPQTAIQVAKAMNVNIYTIGIGSRGITYITIQTPFGPQRRQTETSIDEDLLRKIATETDGLYYRATNAKELQAIFEKIDTLEKTETEMKEYRSYDERMALFAWPALALILLQLILARTRFLTIP